MLPSQAAEAYQASILYIVVVHFDDARGSLRSQISPTHLLSVLLLETLLYSFATLDGLIETSHNTALFPGL